MTRRIVRTAAWCVGVAGVVALGVALPRAQQAQREAPKYPAAAYEEVKPWGPSVKGNFDWEPGGLDVDAKGNIYYLRREDPTIWVVAPDGKVLRNFSKGDFVWAHGMHVDKKGNIWATDCAIGPSASSQSQLHLPNNRPGKGHVVYKFSPKGKLLLTLGKAGNPGTGVDQFFCPADVITDDAGNIYVSDGHEGDHPNGRILKFDAKGKLIKTWGKKGAAQGEFGSPHTLAWDSKGRLFVGDRNNGRIQIFDKDGNFLTQYKAFGGPAGISITKDDTMVVCCPNNQLRIGNAQKDEVTSAIEDVWAEGMAMDEQKNIYVGEVFRHVWRKFSPKK